MPLEEMISLASVPESPQETPVSNPALSPAESTKKSSLGLKVFQNVTAILAGRAITIPLSIATSILLVRFLGREHMGQYGALYAYLSLFAFLSTGALDQILAREASVRRADTAQIFHVATIVAFVFSLFGTALAYLLGPQFGFHGTMHWLILVAAVDMLILPPFRQPGIIFQVDMRQWFAVAIGVMRQALWLIAVALMALHSVAFYHVIIARTLCGFAETAATLFLIRKQGSLSGPRHFVWSEARRLVREAFPLALSTVAVSVYQRIDQVMLHKMSGDKVLGPYVVAVQLTEFFSLLPVALMSTLFPTLSRSASDPQRFDRYLRESYRFLLVVAFAACAVVTPVATPFVELFYGKEFLPTAPLLIVLIWSEVPIFFVVVIMNAMIASRIQRLMPLPAFAGAACNILLNLVLIPRYGALGASWATIVSYCLADIVLLLFLSEARPLVLPGLRVGALPFFIALLITLSLHYLGWSVWIKLAVSALCYTGGVLLTGTLTRSDLERLWTNVRGQFA
jgi:polysaccharide transporter, PST family